VGGIMSKNDSIKRIEKQGFTLLELMIVVAIISILAVVMIPNFVNARNAAKLTSCSTILKNIASIVEMYSTDYEGRYPAFDFTITLSGTPLDGYIDKDYNCPVNKQKYEYKVSSGTTYFIYCPTYSTSLKHRNSRGIINKLFFSPKEGVVIVY
jgi:prepilin-type N-terminal cleavage/methylation domain-containing protein